MLKSTRVEALQTVRSAGGISPVLRLETVSFVRVVHRDTPKQTTIIFVGQGEQHSPLAVTPLAARKFVTLAMYPIISLGIKCMYIGFSRGFN